MAGVRKRGVTLSALALVIGVLATAASAGTLRTITGTAKADRLTGTAQADAISGLGGNDRLTGLGGNDLLVGGPGNDTIVGGAGVDRVRCGTGRDTVQADGRDSVSRDCYCTLRAINSNGAAIAIAFVFDGKEFYEQTTRDGGAFFAFYTYPETFPPGSWGCRAKLDGVVVSQVSFTTTR